jgi:hypothetical protein
MAQPVEYFNGLLALGHSAKTPAIGNVRQFGKLCQQWGSWLDRYSLHRPKANGEGDKTE